ncbi:CLUMA_CG015240, isoform A [Clunio marinus]|uniref:CLUMA_CG015240, isoform A n=1 Tax=Clunio marinus TaxID=568069 RepID=A0A1J1IR46_9DIPT|nr:CLUMA_CG015240, isoform A [Clunio marinus]
MIDYQIKLFEKEFLVNQIINQNTLLICEIKTFLFM